MRNALKISVIAACSILAACTNDAGTPISGPVASPKNSGTIATTDWGAVHNAALSSFVSTYVPSDFPSSTAPNGMTAANMLQGFTQTYLDANSYDTTGFSEWRANAMTSLANWWPNAVTSRPSGWDSFQDSLTNKSAVLRIINYLNTTLMFPPFH